MNNITVYYEDGEEKVAAKAEEYLVKLLNEYKKSPILLLVSGGSAFKILENVDFHFFGKRITISVLDERFSTNEQVNNFSQLSRTRFYKQAKEKGCQFIPTKIGEEDSLSQANIHFDTAIKNWKENNPQGKIIITQGIGEDGHTAGIMPFLENDRLFHELFEGIPMVVGYNVGEKNKYPLRLTVTISFLEKYVDYSLLYVTGENKKQILKNVMTEKNMMYQIPSQVIHKMKDVALFTDIILPEEFSQK